MLEHTLHRVCTTYINFVLFFIRLYIIRPYHPIVNMAVSAAADRVAINAIVDEAAGATADRQ